MVLASTRPVVTLAEAGLRRVATLGRCTPAAWWVTILTVGPLLGSFITEPAAMTICAVLLARQFFDLQPSSRLKDATLRLVDVERAADSLLPIPSCVPSAPVAFMAWPVATSHYPAGDGQARLGRGLDVL